MCLQCYPLVFREQLETRMFAAQKRHTSALAGPTALVLFVLDLLFPPAGVSKLLEGWHQPSQYLIAV